MPWFSKDCNQVAFLKATSVANSSLQAEAKAAKIANAMETPRPNFLTDCQVLAEAAVRKDTLKYRLSGQSLVPTLQIVSLS